MKVDIDINDQEQLARYVRVEHGRVEFTFEGRRILAPQLAAAGWPAHSIRTAHDLDHALLALNRKDFDDAVARLAAMPPSLERKAVLEAAVGSVAEADRLFEILKRRNRLGLRVMKSG